MLRGGAVARKTTELVKLFMQYNTLGLLQAKVCSKAIEA